MLTREENQLLTRVGRGEPAGELLRRYWHPIAFAQELTAENPTAHEMLRSGTGQIEPVRV